MLTTPADPSVAIINGTRRLLQKHGKSPAELDLFIHATTLVTNTLIERKGALTGLIMTRGFRDIIEMGTETRYDIYDLGIDLPPPLVPRAMRREVPSAWMRRVPFSPRSTSPKRVSREVARR